MKKRRPVPGDLVSPHIIEWCTTVWSLRLVVATLLVNNVSDEAARGLKGLQLWVCWLLDPRTGRVTGPYSSTSLARVGGCQEKKDTDRETG